MTPDVKSGSTLLTTRGGSEWGREVSPDHPEFLVLSEERREAPHEATLRLLNETGVDVYELEAVGLWDREGNPAMLLQGHRVCLGTGSDCPNVIDLDSAKRRPVTISPVS